MLGYSANETVVVFSIFAQFFECTHRWNAFFTQIFWYFMVKVEIHTKYWRNFAKIRLCSELSLARSKVTDDMTYALLLLLPVAAAVMVRAYDSCHVTSVKRGDLEGVGGVPQKLDAFYCSFEHFSQFWVLKCCVNFQRWVFWRWRFKLAIGVCKGVSRRPEKISMLRLETVSRRRRKLQNVQGAEAKVTHDFTRILRPNTTSYKMLPGLKK